MFQKVIQKAIISFFAALTIFSFGNAALAQTCQPVLNGLVSWYPAEGNPLDVQSGNNGLLRNGTTFAPGKFSRAFKFDGFDDFVEIPDAANLKPQNVTVEAWVRFDSLFGRTSGEAAPGFQYIIHKKNPRPTEFEGYSLIKLPNHRFAFIVTTNAGQQTVVIDNTQTIVVGRFYHVVASYDGTTVRLYVDGQRVGQAVHGFPLVYGTRPLFIGSSGEGNFDGKMNGVIDEAMIYNRALTDSEVQTNFISRQCRGAEVPADLAAWFAGDGDARDFTGANSAAIEGIVTSSVGKIGQAFDIRGEQDRGSRIRIDSPGIFRGQAEGTIETWVKPRQYMTQNFGLNGIAAESETSRNATRFGLFYTSDSRVAVYAKNSQINASSPGQIPQNQWTHVAATYKGDEGLKLYVNGVQVSATAAALGAFSDTTSGFVGIGSFPTETAADFPFSGEIDEIGFYTRALSAGEIRSIFNAGTAGKIRREATTVGTNIENVLRDATLTFSAVTAAGETSQTPINIFTLPALPATYVHTGLAYDIETTASYSGDVDLCFNLPALAGERFSRLKVLHLENGAWIDRTASTNSPQLCARTSSLSPFVIAEKLQPTAASVTLSGRVMNGRRGIGGARVTLTDANGETRAAITSPFGYYRFENVPAGTYYIVSAYGKRYSFSNPTQVVFVNEEMTDVNFTAFPQFEDKF